MLARRLRRRPNIDPTMVQCLVFAGLVVIMVICEDNQELTHHSELRQDGGYIHPLCTRVTELP